MGDGYALFLAAGELAWEVAEAVSQPHQLERGGSVLHPLGFLEAGELERQLNVLDGGEHRDRG